MISAISGILKNINRHNKILDIILWHTHESFATNLCKTDHNFYAMTSPERKMWDFSYRKMPDNYKHTTDINTIGIIPDLVISQSVGQMGAAANIAQKINIHLIHIEHTTPDGTSMMNHLDKIRQQNTADKTVFITEYNRDIWGYKDDSNAVVINHGIDTDLFSGYVGDRDYILAIVNDYRNREGPLHFSLFESLLKELPTVKFRLRGNSNENLIGLYPNLEIVKSTCVEDLIEDLRHCRCFVNTSRFSPVPMSLLESMSVGCPIVSTNNCGIVDFLTKTNGAWCKTKEDFCNWISSMMIDREISLNI